jgi:hypothetical protein
MKLTHFLLADYANISREGKLNVMELRTTIPRHSSIAKAYVEIAISLVDKLVELQEQQHE